ncbi:MAG: phosphonate ABC transporter, permease protein PhnE [Cellulosilyticum sp.]|nr:phosphonate ABC transporter, permease protein PhnE [Cellulosilyticum sp.]
MQVELNKTNRIKAQFEKQPKTWIFQLVATLVLVGLMVWSSSTVKFNGLTENGFDVAASIINGILHPDTELLFNFTTQGVPYLLLETMCIAFLGTIVGAILAIPISFLSATNIVPKPVALVGRFIIMAIRTIPAFVYGLMFIRMTGPGAFSGLLTMSLCSIGMVSKMYIESIEDMDKRILESLDACGCTTFQKIRYGILPQLMPDFASTIIYRFDMNLRDATVLGLVGAGGIGAPLIFAMNSYRWNEVGAILAGLIVLVLVIEWLSGKIRVKLARG